MRWAVRVAVVVAAMALVVGAGFVWKDHLTGIWGPQSASIPTLGDGGGGDHEGGRELLRPGGDGAEGRFTPPEGFRPDGDRGGGGGEGRPGAWFAAEGLKGFMPLLIPGVLALAGMVAWDRRTRWLRRMRPA